MEPGEFYTYQRLIVLRKETPVIAEGGFELVDRERDKVFAHRRDLDGEHLLVVCNSEKENVPFAIPAEFENGRLLISNYGQPLGGTLRPFEALMLRSI